MIWNSFDLVFQVEQMLQFVVNAWMDVKNSKSKFQLLFEWNSIKKMRKNGRLTLIKYRCLFKALILLPIFFYYCQARNSQLRKIDDCRRVRANYLKKFNVRCKTSWWIRYHKISGFITIQHMRNMILFLFLCLYILIIFASSYFTCKHVKIMWNAIRNAHESDKSVGKDASTVHFMWMWTFFFSIFFFSTHKLKTEREKNKAIKMSFTLQNCAFLQQQH